MCRVNLSCVECRRCISPSYKISKNIKYVAHFHKNLREGKVLAPSSPCKFINVQDNRVDPFVFTNTFVLLQYDEFHKYIDAI